MLTNPEHRGFDGPKARTVALDCCLRWRLINTL